MKKHWRVNLKRLDKYVVDFAIDKGDFWEIDGLNSVVAIGKGRYMEQGQYYEDMPHNVETHWRLHKLYSRIDASNPRSPLALRICSHPCFATVLQMQPSDKIAVDCDPSVQGKLRRMYEQWDRVSMYGPLPFSAEKRNERECLMVQCKDAKWCLPFRRDSKVYKYKT